jgi:alpha-tubulin suppressor-like RCC1 family protein
MLNNIDFGNTASQLAGLTTGVTAMAAAMHHLCAVVSGNVYCLGGNAYGELGNNSTTSSATIVQVVLASGSPLSNVSQIWVGETQSCALSASQLYCWGRNN